MTYQEHKELCRLIKKKPYNRFYFHYRRTKNKWLWKLKNEVFNKK